jgi:hypothetical protein
MEVAAVVAALRRDDAWVVGVQMRWITNGRQYLLPGDMTALVCACAAAAHSARPTRFYVASDSVAAEQQLTQRLLLHNASWQVTVSHANSNTSDGDTGDALVDLSVLSDCDDLIVTQHSSYGLLAASLGGHRPIVVGAYLSASYGVCNPLRAMREDSVVFSNMQQPRSMTMQQVFVQFISAFQQSIISFFGMITITITITITISITITITITISITITIIITITITIIIIITISIIITITITIIITITITINIITPSI